MKKELKKYSLDERRHCPVCGADKAVHLCDIVGRRIGIKEIHDITTKLVNCDSCGFVYANPTIKQEGWNEYYSDMLPAYNSHEVYSVDKRIEMIKKYVQRGRRILEIGGNEQGEFADRLGDIFEEYLSFDVNGNCQNSLGSLERVRDVEVIVSYFVFEHIVDINQLLCKYTDMLVEDGVFIIEVPDATVYYRDSLALYQHEHVNHFTPASLSMLMEKHGFTCVEVSRFLASRDCGFVGVYRKSQCVDSTAQEKIINQSLFTDGLLMLKVREDNIRQAIKRLYEIDGENKLKNLLFWCAGSGLTTIMHKYEEVYGSFEGVIIDEDIKKRDYFGELHPVHTSYEIFEQHEDVNFKGVIVCSYARVNSVRDTLEKYGRDTMEVLYIGHSMELQETS